MAGEQKSGLELKKLVVGPYEENCYILVCPETKESVIIDPGADADKILREAEGTKVKYILLTHGHGDHIGALVQVRSATRAPVAIHQADQEMLKTPVDFNLKEGDIITFGKEQMRVLHTPGHTPGGVCLLLDGYLISGDTLFPGGPGATAHKLGNFPQIIESIREKLFVLPDEILVYPGHGLHTTIGTEKPHLQEWIERGW